MHSMKRYFPLAFLVVLLPFLPPASISGSDQDARITVLFTGDANGHIEPCG